MPPAFRRSAAVLAAALLLGGCDVLFEGLFGGEVAQYTAIRDLSALIPASAASTFQLSIVKSGGSELVLLYSEAGFDSGQDHLVVLSTDLKVLNAYTMNDVLVLPPGGVPLSGSSAVTHLADGRIVIGNVEALAGPGGLQLLDVLHGPLNPVDVRLDGWTIVGPSTAPFTWTGFSTDSSGNLRWSVYPSLWSTVTSQSQSLGKAVSLCGVFTDPESSVHNVGLFAFSESGSDTLYFVQVLKDPDLAGGLAGPPIFDNPAFSVFSKKGLSPSEVHVTADSIIGLDSSSHAWVRFTPSDPGTESRLSTTRRSGMRTAFSFAGGYFCTWDPGARTIVRADTWW